MEERDAIYEVTEVARVYDASGKDYPSYKVRRTCLGRFRRLEDAESLVTRRATERESWYDETILYRISLMPLDVETNSGSALEEYLYGDDGFLLDRRMQPIFHGVFEGRDPGECRFRHGDLCEIVGEDSVTLGIVAAVPFTRKEMSARREKLVVRTFDDLDVCEVIPFSQGGDNHVHPRRRSILDLVSPRYRVHPSTAARLRRLLDGYRTLPVRLAIRNSSQEARLRSVLEDVGLDPTAINKPCLLDDCFSLRFQSGELKGIACNEGEGIDIEISRNIIDRHLDELKVGLSRLTANPLPGRGYRLKEAHPGVSPLYYF